MTFFPVFPRQKKRQNFNIYSHGMHPLCKNLKFSIKLVNNSEGVNSNTGCHFQL